MAGKRVAFAGGGTAGHVFPALAVIRALGGGCDALWIGSRRGMERRLVQQAGIRYLGIPAGKWRRYFSLRNFVDLALVLAGFVRALAVLARERPALLFSKGGYVSVPPVIAAKLLGIPVLTHESDTDPGLATRINSRFADLILTSFPQTESRFPPGLRSRVVTVGNPVREGFLHADPSRGRRLLGLARGARLLLVLGGSLGSEQVNRLVQDALPQLPSDCVVVHQTGGDGRAAVPPGYEGRYRPVAFIGEELPDLMAAADLVVARAGANTLAEVAAVGAAALLVPLDFSGSRGDQVRNAAYFASRGAAVVFAGGSVGEFVRVVTELLNDQSRRAAMAAAARSLASPDASRRIAAIIHERLA